MATYPNVAPIFPKEYEASYLAGIIAGELSKNGKFGTISGSINAPMNDLLDFMKKLLLKAQKNAESKRKKKLRLSELMLIVGAM